MKLQGGEGNTAEIEIAESGRSEGMRWIGLEENERGELFLIAKACCSQYLIAGQLRTNALS